MLGASASSLKKLSSLSMFGISAALSLTACSLRFKKYANFSHSSALKLALNQFNTEASDFFWYTTLPFVVVFSPEDNAA